eukprot:TRINITY_DN15039_c0_g1_i3.p1 TRINITY_DN15039_c0_g1~~TRINITY_DN15039_c0_g1_i3.p1  ORF type:complete len:654 (+),score=60.31 TRINITY_DN15039_c0_g1_i3:93-1964(+)
MAPPRCRAVPVEGPPLGRAAALIRLELAADEGGCLSVLGVGSLLLSTGRAQGGRWGLPGAAQRHWAAPTTPPRGCAVEGDSANPPGTSGTLGTEGLTVSSPDREELSPPAHHCPASYSAPDRRRGPYAELDRLVGKLEQSDGRAQAQPDLDFGKLFLLRGRLGALLRQVERRMAPREAAADPVTPHSGTGSPVPQRVLCDAATQTGPRSRPRRRRGRRGPAPPALAAVPPPQGVAHGVRRGGRLSSPRAPGIASALGNALLGGRAAEAAAAAAARVAEAVPAVSPRGTAGGAVVPGTVPADEVGGATAEEEARLGPHAQPGAVRGRCRESAPERTPGGCRHRAADEAALHANRAQRAGGFFSSVLGTLSSGACSAAARFLPAAAGNGQPSAATSAPSASGGLAHSIRKLAGAFMEGYREELARHEAAQRALGPARAAGQPRAAAVIWRRGPFEDLTPEGQAKKRAEGARFLVSEVCAYRVAAHSVRAWAPVCRNTARAAQWALQHWAVAFRTVSGYAIELQWELELLGRRHPKPFQNEPGTLHHAAIELQYFCATMSHVSGRLITLRCRHANAALKLYHLVRRREVLYADLAVMFAEIQTQANAMCFRALESVKLIESILGPE